MSLDRLSDEELLEQEANVRFSLLSGCPDEREARKALWELEQERERRGLEAIMVEDVW